VAVVIGVSFNGLIGGLVAIPVLGCIRILFLYWLEQRNLLSEAELNDVLEPPKIST
jgi:predicted PurR-regulated permease PerM